jgi:predicted nuclease with TOPRIM domain
VITVLRAYDSGVTEYDIIAREVSGYRTRFEAIEKRLEDVEKVNARLEAAALTTARAMIEISQHWDAVYEAMRRPETGAFSEQMKP